MKKHLSILLLSALGLAACGTPTTDAAPTDTGSQADGTSADGTSADSTATDGNTSDGTSSDAVSSDAAASDAVATDAGTADAGAGGDNCQLGGSSSGDKAPCPTDSFCKLSATNSCGGAGKCTPKPSMCTKELAKVCGCDGKDYDNACKASAAGSNIAHTGGCAGACTVPSAAASGDAKQGTTCADKQYCGGACGKPGACKMKPTACAKIYAPVCGCDGKTYENECSANSAGVSMDYTGKCKPKGTECAVGTAAVGCAKGQFCALPSDSCSGKGVCTEISTNTPCDAQYKPVCGCDGKTYGNACSAKVAGINVAAQGECKEPKGCCTTAKDCGVGASCIGPAGKAVCKGLGNPTTGACWGDSQCPTGSTCEGEQVCPCGVSCLVPDKQGTCKKTLKPKGCDACTASEYCKYVTPNTCSGAGTCTTKPGLCAGIYKPVCGCDGKTYSNACGAAAAGRNVASEGGCKAP